jgi:hypothetical protein
LEAQKRRIRGGLWKENWSTVAKVKFGGCWSGESVNSCVFIKDENGWKGKERHLRQSDEWKAVDWSGEDGKKGK